MKDSHSFDPGSNPGTSTILISTYFGNTREHHFILFFMSHCEAFVNLNSRGRAMTGPVISPDGKWMWTQNGYSSAIVR